MIDELEQDNGKASTDSDNDDSDTNSIDSNDINRKKNVKSKDEQACDKMDDADCNVCTVIIYKL